MGKILRSTGDIALRALLTEAREAEGLTQEQLARRLSKPQSYVWKLENGERVLAYAEASVYARALGMNSNSPRPSLRLTSKPCSANQSAVAAKLRATPISCRHI